MQAVVGNPKAHLRARIRALRYFRLIRGPGGGMADHPDRLALELRAAAHEDIAQIFAALNVSARPLPLDPSLNGFGHPTFTDRFAASPDGSVAEVPSSGVVLMWGVKVNAFQTPGTLELFIVNDDDSYHISLASVESAHAVERHLAGVADRLVAPPKHRTRARAARVRGPGTAMLGLGAALMLPAALAWWHLEGSGPTASGIFGTIIGYLHDRGGSPLTVGAFLVPAILSIGCWWRVRKAARP